MNDRAFKRVAVESFFNVITLNKVLVEWALEPTFATDGPYTFTVYRSHSPSNEAWTLVATTVDQPWAYDSGAIIPQVGYDLFYKVRLTNPHGVSWESTVTHINSNWGRYDWTIAREIVRKEHMLLVKRTGEAGWLLRRRKFGALCPVCVDVDTQRPSDPYCPTCFGTGIDGGYYTPLEMHVSWEQGQAYRKLTAEAGLISDTVDQVRSLAYPNPSPTDIWVSASTNRRFFIGEDIQPLAILRGIPLVNRLTLKAVPVNDVVYRIPTPCAS